MDWGLATARCRPCRAAYSMSTVVTRVWRVAAAHEMVQSQSARSEPVAVRSGLRSSENPRSAFGRRATAYALLFAWTAAR